MQLFQRNESDATLRRLYFYLVDATDGLTPETGEAGGQPQISKNGAGFVNTANVLIHAGYGRYYVVLAVVELDSRGVLLGRYKSANTAEAPAMAMISVYDPSLEGALADLSLHFNAA